MTIARRSNGPGGEALDSANYDVDETVDISPYLIKLRSRWRTLALVTFVAMLSMYLFAKLFMTQWYQALAILRPVQQPAIQGKLAGILGTLSGSLSAVGGLAQSIAPGEAASAEELVTMLQTYEFSTSLAEKHDLSRALWGPAPPKPAAQNSWLSTLFRKRDPKWVRYETLKTRFSCEYTHKTGSLTMYFVARDRADAEQALNYYIEELRARLRKRQIEDATTAINTLSEEARSTSDTILQAQLYELLAKQIQMRKLAQVEADFAFVVMEPPITPDRTFRPTATFDALAVGFLTALSMAAWIVLTESGSEGREQPPQYPRSANGEYKSVSAAD